MKPKKGKSVTVSTFSPSVCHEVMGPDAMILVFWMLRLFGTFLWLLPPVEVLTVFILSFSWSLSVSLWVLVWSPYQRDYLCLFCKVFLMRFYLFNNLKHTPLSPCFAWLSVCVCFCTSDETAVSPSLEGKALCRWCVRSRSAMPAGHWSQAASLVWTVWDNHLWGATTSV